MERKTVLVVEDQQDLRALYCEALALAGFLVREAADGMEALRLIDSAPPNAVVLDLGLPQVTGYDVLFELKEHSYTRGIPVVVVTGRNDPVKNVPADCVMVKPVTPDGLVRQVRRCLGLASSDDVM